MRGATIAAVAAAFAATLELVLEFVAALEALARTAIPGALVAARSSFTICGGIALVGDLADAPTYFDAAVASDGIIHAAFDAKVGADLDRHTTSTLLAAAARRAESGLESAFIYTSGTWVLGDAPEPVDETAPLAPPEIAAWRPGVEQAVLEKKDMQFLYRDGDEYVFMDLETYDQQNVSPVALGDAADYMVENSVAIIAFYNGDIVTVEIPASVELTITETEPGIQGDRVSGARKPATLETGKVVQVPLFINSGDKVKVDTRDGSYLGRIN